jgi:hypothetical protein
VKTNSYLEKIVFFFLEMKVACMIFEIIMEIEGIGDERCPLFKTMCGCWVGCFKVVGCYCGCRTPMLHGHNLSRLGFNSPRGDEYYCVCEHLT